MLLSIHSSLTVQLDEPSAALDKGDRDGRFLWWEGKWKGVSTRGESDRVFFSAAARRLSLLSATSRVPRHPASPCPTRTLRPKVCTLSVGAMVVVCVVCV